MTSRDLRMAELSRTIDPRDLGRRIRRARIAAGLRQSDLAGDDVSAAYITRIESGQRRPEFGLLGRIASRMGTSLEELLEDDAASDRMSLALALDHADLALAGGEPRKALEAVEQLDATLIGDGSADFRYRCDMIRATALEAIGQLNQAILVLERLSDQPTPTADWVRSLIALSRCYRETGNLDRAISVGEDAEKKIAELGLVGLTESIQLTVTVASAYMFRGDLDLAMRMCLKAIDEAERVESPIARASAYWNASLVESRTGSNRVALDLARKALTYFEIGEDGRNLARLRGHVADMQLELDPPDASGAIATLDRARRELEWSAGSAVDQASQLQTRARAHLLLGDRDEASRCIHKSLELTPQDAVVERAYGYSVIGQIEMAGGTVDAARRAFLTAVQLLSGVGADREAAQLWFDLGVRLKEIGEVEAALDAFHRAAASTGLKAGSVQNSASTKSR